jgi:hypothetical protein
VAPVFFGSLIFAELEGTLFCGSCGEAVRKETDSAQLFCRRRDEVGALREFSALEKCPLHAGDVCRMTFTNKNLQPGVIRELEFDSMTATAGTGLRGTYEIHLTNAGKNIRQVRPFRKLLLNRFNSAETIRILIHVSSQVFRGKLGKHA